MRAFYDRAKRKPLKQTQQERQVKALYEDARMHMGIRAAVKHVAGIVFLSEEQVREMIGLSV